MVVGDSGKSKSLRSKDSLRVEVEVRSFALSPRLLTDLEESVLANLIAVHRLIRIHDGVVVEHALEDESLPYLLIRDCQRKLPCNVGKQSPLVYHPTPSFHEARLVRG
jgi:hypothetical protein